MVTLIVDIEARHRHYLDRKKRELAHADQLCDDPEAITDDAVVRQLFEAWMALEANSTLEVNDEPTTAPGKTDDSVHQGEDLS
jgi:hypothetical protein